MLKTLPRLSQEVIQIVTPVILICCSSSLHAVSFDWSIVGNPGNPNDTHFSGFGGVDYVYRMSKHEVTNAQYAEFLNAVATTDTHDLFNIRMQIFTIGGIVRSGAPGSYSYSVKPPASGFGPGGSDYSYENKPVNYVSYFNAMRFVNWLENGQPSGLQGPGSTEHGVYAISDGVSEVRDPNAGFFIPSRDEWYKAAYYDPNGLYYDYATASDTQPDNNLPSSDSGNSANYFNGTYTTGDASFPMTNVGAYQLSASPYGTYDQSGNVWEWTEEVLNSLARVYRGASWAPTFPGDVMAGVTLSGQPSSSFKATGFRVASSIPEPTTCTLAALCLAMSRRRAF